MERLTTTDGQLYACGLGACNDMPGIACGDNCPYQEAAMEKLTDYEGIGLEPNEIRYLIEQMQAMNFQFARGSTKSIRQLRFFELFNKAVTKERSAE